MRNSRIQLGWTVTSLPGQPAQDMVASSHPRLHVGQPLNPSFNQRFLSLAAFFDRPPTRGQRPSEYRFLARRQRLAAPWPLCRRDSSIRITDLICTKGKIIKNISLIFVTRIFRNWRPFPRESDAFGAKSVKHGLVDVLRSSALAGRYPALPGACLAPLTMGCALPKGHVTTPPEVSNFVAQLPSLGRCARESSPSDRAAEPSVASSEL